MFIIGMHGAKRSGKDFGAAELKESLKREGHVNVHLTSFAKSLRQLAVFTTGCRPDQIDKEKDVRAVYHLSTIALQMWLGRIPGGWPRANPNDLLALLAEELRTQAKHSGMSYFHDIESEGYVIRGTGRDLLIVLGQLCRRLDPDFWVMRVREELDTLPQDNQVVILTDVRPENEAAACDFVISVSRRGYAFEGTATEAPLPDHLVHARLDNDGSNTYVKLLRYMTPRLLMLMRGAANDTPEMKARRAWLTPQLYNRAFMEVR